MNIFKMKSRRLRLKLSPSIFVFMACGLLVTFFSSPTSANSYSSNHDNEVFGVLSSLLFGESYETPSPSSRKILQITSAGDHQRFCGMTEDADGNSECNWPKVITKMN